MDFMQEFNQSRLQFTEGCTTWGAGDVILATCKKESIETDPILAEALGIRWCLQLAIDQQLQNVVIFSDALVVVNCIKGRTCVAAIEHIVQDCISLMINFKDVIVLA